MIAAAEAEKLGRVHTVESAGQNAARMPYPVAQ